MFTVQIDPETESQPVQPPKVEAPVGAAVNMTVFPLVKLPLHDAVQLMPAGELLTVPFPEPRNITVKVGVVPWKPGHPFTTRLLTVTFI